MPEPSLAPRVALDPLMHGRAPQAGDGVREAHEQRHFAERHGLVPAELEYLDLVSGKDTLRRSDFAPDDRGRRGGEVRGPADRWMRAARGLRQARRPIGPVPHRTCTLCRSGDHDLVPTYDVKVSVVGYGPVAPVRVATPRTRRTKADRLREMRAGAQPPDAVDAQWRAAGRR